MNYLILAAIVVIVVLLVILFYNRRSLERKIRQIRLAWGKPKTDSFYFDRIRKYADTVPTNTFHRLTEQTLNDIDFYRLFEFIDRTTSKVGQQFLFRKLVEPTNLVADKSEPLIELLAKDSQLREGVQMELLKLSNNDAYHIASLLQDTLLVKPWWFGLLTLDLVLVVSLAVLSIAFPVLLIVLIAPVALNVYLHYWNKGNTAQFVRSIPQLNLLVDVSGGLTKRGNLFHDKEVEGHISGLKPFQRKASLIRFDNSVGIQAELSLLATYLVEMIKAILLIEILSLYKVTKELEGRQSSIVTLFDYVGNIDASISIASLRAGSKKTCLPVFVLPKKEVAARGMYHPLIEDCIGNDLSINGKSILITGSNMSGKSTFLRTLTINSILAQTIYTCFADAYVSPIVKQFSSIRIDDNLFQGESYYLQEVKLMASLIAEVDSPHQILVVLDEVFKGTNTVERIAAAKAILSYLNRNDNIVVVSTHDLELADLLEQEYALYHFTETIENNELHFDHILKNGQLRTRNAIKILELANYPDDIVNEARNLSTTLRAARMTGGG